MRNLFLCLLMVPGWLFAANESETTVTHTRITEHEASVAKQFGLKPEEWERYKILKEGPAGYKNPNMNPVFMLALYARTPAEQLRFAQIKAQLDYEYIGKLRSLQNTYLKHFNQSYPDAQVIDLDGMYLPSNKNAVNRTFQPQANDRVVLVIKDNCTSCDEVYRNLFQFIEKIRLDIHFDTNDESVIRSWAKRNKIPVNLVKSKRITLNKPGSFLKDWGITSFPTVFKRSFHDADYIQVDL